MLQHFSSTARHSVAFVACRHNCMRLFCAPQCVSWRPSSTCLPQLFVAYYSPPSHSLLPFSQPRHPAPAHHRTIQYDSQCMGVADCETSAADLLRVCLDLLHVTPVVRFRMRWFCSRRSRASACALRPTRMCPLGRLFGASPHFCIRVAEALHVTTLRRSPRQCAPYPTSKAVKSTADSMREVN